MSSNLKIRNYEEKDKPGILQLHQDAIEPVVLDMYPFHRASLERRLVPEQTMVAEVEGKVAGFISLERFDQLSYLTLMDFLRKLALAQDTGYRATIRNDRKRVREELGKGQVILEYFKVAQRIDILSIPGESILGTNMVVSEKYRSNGVGYSLAHHTLEKVLERKPPVIFAQLIDGSPSVSICDKLGFKSLFRYGPHYSNGAATHLMIYGPTAK